MVRSLSYISGISLLYFKVGPSVHRFLVWSPCSSGSSLFLVVGGFRSASREWWKPSRSVFLGDGSSCSYPIPVGQDGLLARSGLDGCLVICPSVPSPHVLPYTAFDLSAARPLRDALLLSDGLAWSQPPGMMEWCQRGHVDSVRDD